MSNWFLSQAVKQCNVNEMNAMEDSVLIEEYRLDALDTLSSGSEPINFASITMVLKLMIEVGKGGTHVSYRLSVYLLSECFL